MKVLYRKHSDSAPSVTECDNITFGKMREPVDTGLKLFAKDSGGFTFRIVDIEDVIAVLP